MNPYKYDNIILSKNHLLETGLELTNYLVCMVLL